MVLNIADLTVTSPDIKPLERIDDRLSLDHDNEIPQVDVSGVPADAVELALILHDPDAPLPNGFTHWTVYGLPARDGRVNLDANGARTGTNGIGETSYSGPQPPAGHGTHHYYLWVYALDRPVSGAPTREEFLAHYGEAILEQNRLVATYSR
jgi:Raf kinase inhibitor-like YbhB/YbcL family protein